MLYSDFSETSQKILRTFGTMQNIRFVKGDSIMADSVYKVIELIGTSTESWEKAAAAAVERASQSLRELRVAEVVELDMVIEDGKVTAYRAKIKVSFKYESGG
jgi:flavin-binding protein dodecin